MCALPISRFFFIFFFNDTATTEIYTLSLHDALPICLLGTGPRQNRSVRCALGAKFVSPNSLTRPSELSLTPSFDHGALLSVAPPDRAC